MNGYEYDNVDVDYRESFKFLRFEIYNSWLSLNLEKEDKSVNYTNLLTLKASKIKK